MNKLDIRIQLIYKEHNKDYDELKSMNKKSLLELYHSSKRKCN